MSKILIIALHGKNSHPNKSATIKAIRERFSNENEFRILAPAYDSTKRFGELVEYFDLLLPRLNKIAEKHEIVAVVGTSLGGFWARYIASKITGAGWIGLNPSMLFYGIGVIGCGFGENPNTPKRLIIAGDDDVVDPNVAVDMFRGDAHITVIDGGHRFTENLGTVLALVEKSIYTLHD